MRGLRLVGPALAAMAASAGVATGYRQLFTPSNVWGPDGTPFDGTRTSSKKTKRLANLPARYAEAHQAKRKAARRSAKHARRAAA